MKRVAILTLVMGLTYSTAALATPTSCPSSYQSKNPDSSFWQEGAPVLSDGSPLAEVIIISTDGTATGNVQCQYNFYGSPILGYQSIPFVQADNSANWTPQGSGSIKHFVCNGPLSVCTFHL